MTPKSLSGIRRGIESQSLLELEAAMARATSSRVAEAVRRSPLFQEALDVHFQLRIPDWTSDAVKSLTLVGLLFMCEQPRPNMHLLALLKATYLLLGEKEKDVSVRLQDSTSPLRMYSNSKRFALKKIHRRLSFY